MNCCQSPILLKSNIPLRPQSTLALIYRQLNISHVYSNSISELFTSGLDYGCCSGSVYFSRSSFPWPEFDFTFCWAEWLSSCLGSRLQAWLLCPGTSLNPLVSTAFFKYIWWVWVFGKLCKKWHSIFSNRDVSDRVAIMINLLSSREMILELYHRSP